MMPLETKNIKGSPVGYVLGSAILSLFLLMTLMRGAFADWKTFASGFLWAFSISITQWVGLDIIYGWIDRRVSWMKTPAKKVFIQVLTFLTYSTIAFILVQFFNYYIWLNVVPANSWDGIV